MKTILCVAIVLSGCSLPPPKIEPSGLIQIVPHTVEYTVEAKSHSSRIPPVTAAMKRDEPGVFPLLLMLMGGVGVGMMITSGGD